MSREPGSRLPSQQALASAYRDWLLLQSVEEGARRCERIFAVRSELSQYLRDLTRDWSTRRLQSLMGGRIKARRWTPLTPIALNDEESEVCEEFEWPVLNFRTKGPAAVYNSPLVGPVEVDASKLGLADLRSRFLQGHFRVDKRAMRKELRDVLDPALGRRRGNAGCWRYTRSLEGVTVCTDVDFASAGGGQFRYWHILVAGEDAEDVGLTSGRVLLSQVSLFNMLGMDTTQWTYLTDAEIPAAAAQLARLCTEFLSAMPGILSAARREQERLDGEAVGRLH